MPPWETWSIDDAPVYEISPTISFVMSDKNAELIKWLLNDRAGCKDIDWTFLDLLLLQKE